MKLKQLRDWSVQIVHECPDRLQETSRDPVLLLRSPAAEHPPRRIAIHFGLPGELVNGHLTAQFAQVILSIMTGKSTAVAEISTHQRGIYS